MSAKILFVVALDAPDAQAALLQLSARLPFVTGDHISKVENALVGEDASGKETMSTLRKFGVVHRCREEKDLRTLVRGSSYTLVHSIGANHDFGLRNFSNRALLIAELTTLSSRDPATACVPLVPVPLHDVRARATARADRHQA